MIKFDEFVKNHTILDAELLNINIQAKNHIVQVELIVKLRSNIIIKFVFIDII